MSAPMENVAFCTILNEADLLSVKKAYTEDTVIISSKRKIFDVYNISDQKCVKSWSVRHGITLTSPVLWNSELEKFITVTNDQDVCLWDKENADFEKCKKKHSTTKIHGVLSIDGFEPVILYTNGSVDFLSKIKDDHSKGHLKNTQKICWYTAARLGSALTVIYAVNTRTEVQLHTHKYDTDSTVWHHEVEVEASPGGAELCSCDAYLQADSFKIFFLWSNGQVSTLMVNSRNIERGPSRSVSGTSSKSTVLALDDIHVVIAGLKEDKKNGIGIYDTKFGVVKSWYQFPDKCVTKPKIFKVDSHLFLPCGTTLYRCKYECEASTLISLLGQAATTGHADTVPNHYVWKLRKEKPNVSQESTEVGELLSATINPKLDYSNFKRKFNTLMDALKKIENCHWLTTSHMALLLQRIMGEKKFWAKEELLELVELNCVPMSVMDELFSVLVQQSEINILHKVLQSLPNIPEKCLCTAISFFLNCDEEKLPVSNEMEDQSDEEEDEGSTSNHDDEDVDTANGEENTNNPDDEDTDTANGDPEKPCTCPISSDRAAVINEILCLPYSDTFLLECLRKISFKDALKLLDYLCYQLQARAGFHKDYAKQKLSQTQLVDWLCLVLDAHIPQFVLSPDSHMTIVKLESVVNKQVKFFDGLVVLDALLEHFKQKIELPQEKKIGHYCIEVLHVY